MNNPPSNSHILIYKDLLLALLLFVSTLLLGSFLMVEGVTGVYHDDGVYVSTAKALGEGQGYRLINLPDAPDQTKYPPLYPLILALIWIIYPHIPGNLVIMQWVTLICGGAFVGMSYLYLVRFRYASRSVVAASAVLTLSATQFLYFSTQILSEIPFALLAIMALWAFEKQEEGSFKSRTGQFLLGGLSCLPFLTRLVGIVFLPLAFFKMWLKKKPVGWTILGCVIFLLPWVIWIFFAFQSNPSDSSDVWYTDYMTWWFNYIKSDFINVIFWNLLYVTTGTVSIGVGLFNTSLFFPTGGLLFVVLIGFIIWIFIVADMFRGRILPLFLIGYLIIILVWPWPPTRFLIPILPFLLVYFLNPLVKLFKRIPDRLHSKKIFNLILCMILFPNLVLTFNTIQLSRDTSYPYMTSMRDPVSWQSHENLFKWIEENTQKEDIIASGLDTMIYVYTERTGFRPFIANPMVMFYGKKDISALGTEEELIELIKTKNAQYLAHMPMPYFSEEKYLSEAITEIKKKYPGFLDEVYRGDDERFVVYRIRLGEH